MPKRKYAAFTEPTSTRLLKRDPDQEHNRVQAVIDNGVSSITHALKIARGFERQKLGRRQKAAKEESNQLDVTGRLNAEVAALKALDLARTAELHLYKTLLKVKRIANSSTLPDHVRHVVTTEKASNDIANVNVQARLFNSTPVKTAVGQTLNDVGSTLGIKDIGGHAGKKRLRAKDFEQRADRATGEDINFGPKSEAGHINTDQGSVSAEIWSGLESDKDSLGEQAQEVNYDEFERRIADSDEEAAESQDSNNFSRHSNSDWSGSDDEFELDPAMSTSEETKERLHPQRQNPSKPSKSRTGGESLTATTFLPTLSMGGYWSGGSDDGSDHDDDDDDVDSLSHEPKRKNKRGQRARQAIYEKKYGQNANHLKKQPQGSIKQGDRDQGWDPRSGARDDRPRNGRRQQNDKDEFGRDVSRRKAKQNAIQGNRKQRRAAGKENQVVKSGANNDPVVNLRKRVPAGETHNASQDAKKEALHPSWEAAKKAKETKKAMPFQGKKITFD